MSKEIAKGLLKIQAVFLRPNEPFTWASGIKSPIYCDNRLILTDPEVRNTVENEMARVVKEKYPECEKLMGTSTAGIAHAAIAAHILDMPMGYVRGSAKTHGRNNRIEGKLEKGDKLLLCSDGLTNMVEDEDILQLVKKSASLKEAAERLVTEANKNGGKDNISVVLAEYE